MGRPRAIEIQGKSKRFGNRVAVDDVTFEVHAGGIMVLIRDHTVTASTARTIAFHKIHKTSRGLRERDPQRNRAAVEPP